MNKFTSEETQFSIKTLSIYNYFKEDSIELKYFQNKKEVLNFAEEFNIELESVFGGDLRGSNGSYYMKNNDRYFYFMDNLDFQLNSSNLFLINSRIFLRSFSDIEIDRLLLYYNFTIHENLSTKNEGSYICHLKLVDKFLKVSVNYEAELSEIIQMPYPIDSSKYSHAIIFDNLDDISLFLRSEDDDEH